MQHNDVSEQLQSQEAKIHLLEILWSEKIQLFDLFF